MKEMLIRFADEEASVAVLENGQLAEVYLPQLGERNLVGSIYKGRVENVLPGMQAAFVDIGLERNCFLYVDDVYKPSGLYGGPRAAEAAAQPQEIGSLLKSQQEVLVQVFKEPVGSKGARVTMQPTLPGRYLVLLPNGDYIAISRRIEDEEERERLRGIMQELLPEGGAIVRTAAQGMSKEELSEDCKSLFKQWRRIQGKAAKSGAPALIYRDQDLLKKVIRDTNEADLDRILVANQEAAEKVREMIDAVAPGLRCPVLVKPSADLFADFAVLEQMEKALRRKVWLKSGGYVVFDQTEALTVVDVNTGKYVGGLSLEDTVLTTNLEAVQEIARQLRLRNIGGIIVVDFINMEKPEDKQQLLNVLEATLKKDRTRITMLGMTALGLVELTRKKLGHELSHTLEKECPFCQGKGLVLREEVVAERLQREIVREAENLLTPEILVCANAAVTAALIGPQGRRLSALEQQTGKTITVRAENGRRMEDTSVHGIYGSTPLPPPADGPL